MVWNFLLCIKERIVTRDQNTFSLVSLRIPFCCNVRYACISWNQLSSIDLVFRIEKNDFLCYKSFSSTR